MNRFIFARPDKVFHLHLFKLARAKDEVAGRHFVAKRLANLGHTERKFAPAGGQHVQKVDEDALRGFGAQIDQRRGVVFRSGANVRAKHQVKWPWFG